VCHAPVALVNVREGRQYLVKGKRVTGNAEEAVELDRGRTFLLEDRLKERVHLQQNRQLGSLCPSGREARDRTESGIFGTRSGRVAGCFALLS